MKSRISKPVITWLWIGLVMIIIQIILGGITRLTGSGLSITEWEVITGSVPPLNDQDWATEFSKYQETPQYRLLNSDFTISDFKFIYFWEWFHRLWGRLIGIVFILPFVFFLLQKRFTKEMIWPLVILFLLGGLQGAIGWIMVASGLTGDAVYVKPTRLALHFIFAMILLVYTWWFLQKLRINRTDIVDHRPLRNFTWTIIIILFIQLAFGALMAGHRAAPAAPTWPDINGSFIPSYVWKQGLIGILEDRIVIQFIHRMLAYILVVMIFIWSFKAYRITASFRFRKTAYYPLLLVLVQTGLGIFTVLTSVYIRPAVWNVFEWMAQLHQFVALLLLLSLVFAAFLLEKRSIIWNS